MPVRVGLWREGRGKAGGKGRACFWMSRFLTLCFLSARSTCVSSLGAPGFGNSCPTNTSRPNLHRGEARHGKALDFVGHGEVEVEQHVQFQGRHLIKRRRSGRGGEPTQTPKPRTPRDAQQERRNEKCGR